MNFFRRVRIPILMLNGRHDYGIPMETAQIPMFQYLGTPDRDKRRVVFEAAHEVVAVRTQVIRELLDWFYRYLGPITRK